MGFLNRIDSYQDDMIRDLQGLLAIPGVAEEADGDMPFGKDVHRAFLYMLGLAKKEGFVVFNADNYGGHIEFGGPTGEDEKSDKNDEIMGVLTHLDVVPAGKDWDYPPFEGHIEEGRIYGRGAIDNKGPTIAAFYAMKALKDEGIVPKKKIRLILGLDEEAGTGWKGMEAYFDRAKKPSFGFTPDAEFPAIHGEMGIMIFDLVKKIDKSRRKGVELRSLTGGNAANMVADYARVVLNAESYENIRIKIDEYEKVTGYKLSSKGIGRSLEVTAMGISSHGARPEKGLNAISVLMGFLKTIDLANDDLIDFIDFYNEHIGFNLNGENIGCGFSDLVSGKLIFNVGMAEFNDEVVKLTVNIRYPVTLNEERVYSQMMPFLDKYEIGVVKTNHQPPIYIPADSPLIETLMGVYRKHTGDTESKPLVIGGGTYARAMENAVAFGMAFPDEPELAHQKNEYITIDNFVKAAKIFADSIYELTK
ncbi:MAG TPA: dipeptidase PepV [Anaerovoracaceae bacterium]|nr:dipeptidase PepV [Anaerovoracaceae bacterium]